MLRRRSSLATVYLLYISACAVALYWLFHYHPALVLQQQDDTIAIDPASAARSAAAAAEAQRCSPRGGASMQGHGDPLASDLDVWIVAGQSNAVGDNWRDASPLPDASAPAGDAILCFSPAAAMQARLSQAAAAAGAAAVAGADSASAFGVWVPATPNIHVGVHNYSQPASVGPDMSFARSLIAEGLARRVGLVPTAKCNTDLANDWSPVVAAAGGGGAGGGGEGEGGGKGRYYDHMLRATRAAMAAAPQVAAGGRSRLAGMVWVQGESDAVDPQKAVPYRANLVAFIAAVREDLAAYHPCLPIILGVVSPRQESPKLPLMGTIRRQQLELELPGVIKADMDRHQFYAQGGITLHLSKAGQATFGVEMALAYKAWWRQGNR